MASNEAAWLTGLTAHPFVVNSAPKPQPGPGQIVIQNAAVAVNPVDWKIQAHGDFLDRTKYPFILGQDVAGIVEDVGPGVTRFQKGQRVIAHCPGLITTDPANAGFQLYPLVNEVLVAEIPDSVKFEEAVVLPLAASTAASGLYTSDALNLPLPSVSEAKQTGQTVLVWGGASSVGATVIQFAVASGLNVITTASAANHELVKSWGASVAFDYKSPTVVEDIATALADTDFVVYDAISEEESFAPVAEILDKLNRTVKVVSVLPYKNPSERFAPKFVVAFDLIKEGNKHVGEWIWGEFLPQALASGKFQAKPDPLVVGTGLKDIQHGLDVQKQGVSAKKVVVTI